MFSEFFGNYLLNKGVISGTELGRVLQNQKETRLQLGVLAINSGYMTAEQVEEVHQLQAQRDRRFGEIAVIEMYLTPTQLEKLIREQQSEHLILAQALIDANLMTMDAFQEHLNNYKRDYELTDYQFDSLIKGHVDQVLGNLLKFSESSPKTELKEYVTLFYKNLVRFIDRSVLVEAAKPVQEEKYNFLFSQKIFGAQKYFTAIAGEESVLLRLAEINANESFERMDDYAIDSVGEYLNLHNGLFLVNMSDKHVNLHMHAQTWKKDLTFTSEDEIYKIPFSFSFGRFDLLVGQMKDIE